MAPENRSFIRYLNMSAAVIVAGATIAVAGVTPAAANELMMRRGGDHMAGHGMHRMHNQSSHGHGMRGHGLRNLAIGIGAGIAADVISRQSAYADDYAPPKARGVDYQARKVKRAGKTAPGNGLRVATRGDLKTRSDTVSNDKGPNVPLGGSAAGWTKIQGSDGGWIWINRYGMTMPADPPKDDPPKGQHGPTTPLGGTANNNPDGGTKAPPGKEWGWPTTPGGAQAKPDEGTKTPSDKDTDNGGKKPDKAVAKAPDEDDDWIKEAGSSTGKPPKRPPTTAGATDDRFPGMTTDVVWVDGKKVVRHSASVTDPKTGITTTITWQDGKPTITHTMTDPRFGTVHTVTIDPELKPYWRKVQVDIGGMIVEEWFLVDPRTGPLEQPKPAEKQAKKAKAQDDELLEGD